MNLIRIYVITLKSASEFIRSETYKSLKQLDTKITLVKGVILDEETSNKYFFYAKSSIGISLAHRKVWKLINKNYKNNKVKNNKDKNNSESYQINNWSLIFEDDVQISSDDTLKQLNEIINKLDKEHNNNEQNNKELNNKENNKIYIYKLHSDFNNGFTSLAAYLVNNETISELIDSHKILLGHVDFDLNLLNLLKKINIRTHEKNLFLTDESNSTNRNEKYNLLNLLGNFKLSKRSDKTIKQLLSYKVFRIYNYETIAYEIILLFLLILSILFSKKYLIISILFLFLI